MGPEEITRQFYRPLFALQPKHFDTAAKAPLLNRTRGEFIIVVRITLYPNRDDPWNLALQGLFYPEGSVPLN